MKQEFVATSVQYASLTRRLIAAIVDLVVVMLVVVPLTNWTVSFISNGGDLPALMMDYFERHASADISVSDMVHYLESHNAIIPYILSQVISLLMVMAYCVAFWCWQGATLGKMLLRIKVIDMKSGGALTLRQAIARVFGYVLSSVILCLGFVMINFRKDCRGLHDMVAGTAVIVQPLN